MMTLETIRHAERLLQRGRSQLEVSQILDVSRSSVNQIARGKHPCQLRPEKWARKKVTRSVDVTAPFIPSIEEIERLRDEINSAWSPKERATRRILATSLGAPGERVGPKAVAPTRRWRPPTIRTADLVA